MRFRGDERSITRMRRTKQAVGLTLAVLLLVLGSVQVAVARPSFATSTTRFAIAQQTFTVSVTLDARSARMIRGPVAIVVKLPPDIAGHLTSADRGFNRRGYEISFQADPTLTDEALLLVTVPSRGPSVPLSVDSGSSGGYALGAPGYTNQSVALAISI